MSFKHTVTMTLAATASAASLNAIAVPLTVDSGMGSATIWSSNSCAVGMVCPDTVPTVPKAQAVLDGIGNVELNKFGAAPATVMSGSFGVGGPTITLSSLVLADWTANGNELAMDYIQDAWLSLFSAPLTNAQLATGAAQLIGLNLWKQLSDPNVSYVNNDGGVVHIGLDGLLDATTFLDGLAFGITGNHLPSGVVAQASEVVKVTYNGETDYLYGFHATPTGYTAADGRSFGGNYEVTIPEPAALWLLGIGLVGLVVSRRR